MPSFLKYFRYFIFGLFLISNAIIATVAVWNLNLLQNTLPKASPLPLRVDAYLIFIGCAGLALIFPILFCELARKTTFLVKAWFECGWTALFAIMELAGAAAASAAGVDEGLCSIRLRLPISANRRAICASSRVLQGFAWLCGLILLGYFLLLFVATLLQRREDNTIWHCNVGRFPWGSAHSQLYSPDCFEKSVTAPTKRSITPKAPTIVAPRPRRAEAVTSQAPIFSYRSGLSEEYAIEHYRPEAPPTPLERPLPLVPPPAVVRAAAVTMTNVAAAPANFALYPQHIQRQLPRTSAEAPVENTSAPLQPPSPNPIGNWPRLNPPTPRLRSKAVALAQREEAAPSLSSPSAPQPPRLDPSTSQMSRPTLPPGVRPLPNPRESVENRSGGNAVASHASSSLPSSRSRPVGPRRPSLDDGHATVLRSLPHMTYRNLHS